MSDDRTFERNARAWLELGPTDPPDRVVQAALLTIESTSQERVLRIPWRFPTMTTQARLGAAAILGVLAIGGGLLYFNRGPDIGTPTQSPNPTATTTPSGSTGAVDYSTIPGWIVFEHFGFALDGTTTEFDNDIRQIGLVHADGTDRHELSPGTPQGKTSPDISPDGTTVVFASWEPLSTIWQTPIEGGVATQIVIDCTAPSGTDCRLDDPAYSPDGTSIAFVRTEYSATTLSSRIGIHDLESGGTRLIEATLVTDGLLAQPTWSPDGLQLAYHHNTMANLDAQPTEIRIDVVKVDGTGLHELPAPDGATRAGDPDWSPDGSLIVFSTMPHREGEGDQNGDPGVYTIRPDGTGLTDVCGACFQGGVAPSWTPDGEHILFWGFRSWALVEPDGDNPAHINQLELSWFGEGLGYSYFALLQPSP